MMYPLLPLLAALMTWQPAQDLTVSTFGPNADQGIDAQPTISPAPTPTNGSGPAPLRAMRGGEQCLGNLNLHPDLVLDTGGIACASGGFTTQNNFAKVYDLSVLAPDTPWRIDCIESAITNSGSAVVATLNLYLDTDGSPPRGPGIDLELIASTPAIVPYSDDLIWIQSTFSDSVCVPANSILVVEIDIPASDTGFAVFAGSSGLGDQTWLRAEDSCGIPEYVAFNTLGFAIEWLQVINGGPDDCDGDICPLCLPADCNKNGIDDDFDIYDGTSSDCDGNAIPDECDPMEDCNQNGVFDPCEIDCDGSGTPDDCDISNDPSLDCDGNGVIDNCDPDCDGNGQSDACEMLQNPELDCDEDGRLDFCDILSGDAIDANQNGIFDCCEGLIPECFPSESDALDYASWGRSTLWGNPPACIGHVVTSNLLVGGVDENGIYLSSFWDRNRSGDLEWKPSADPGPPPHRNAGMAEVDGRSILFGGRHEDDILNSTWIHEESAWRELETDGPGPQGRTDHAMIGTELGALLFGGRAGQTLDTAEDMNDMWIFIDDAWIEIQSKHAPDPRHGHQRASGPHGSATGARGSPSQAQPATKNEVHTHRRTARRRRTFGLLREYTEGLAPRHEQRYD